ncbi:hypothetical protein LA6_002758 [Marinibacterium anthonyi]|nr:hypothetical protein LA6_002758 [Marinibacterium anthonyi]
MHGIVNVSLRGDGKIRKGMLLMYWSDLTQNWSLWFSRFKAQFPNLDDASMPFLKLDRNRFEAHLAETHDMTLNEAREAVNGFLYIETLARAQGQSKASVDA